MARLGKSTKKTYNKTRKSKALTVKQVKAVTSIAKKVTSKAEETKFFNYSSGTTYPTLDNITSWNIFYHGCSRGVGNNQFEGDVIQWRGLKIKWQFLNYSGAIRGWVENPIKCVIMLISLPKYVTTTSLVLNDIRDDNNSSLERFFMNNDTKVHYKKEISLPSGKAGDKKIKTGNIWIKRNQKIQYKDFETDYQLKDRQYYLVTYAMDQSRSLSDPAVAGQLIFSYKNYFKDS